MACINIYAEITFHTILDYWSYLKNNQDVSSIANHVGHGKHATSSSSKALTDDFSLSKMKNKDISEDFLPFSRNGTLNHEPVVSSTMNSSDNMKLSLADRIAGKELPTLSKSDSLRKSVEGSDISYHNSRSYSNDLKWNSNKDTPELGFKSTKLLANADDKVDMEDTKLHSEFNGNKFSASSLKNKISSDNFRKFNLPPVLSKPLDFDRKCAWDIQWASVSKINLICMPQVKFPIIIYFLIKNTL